MIGHDDVDALLGHQRNFVNGADPAVCRDDQLRALLGRFLKGMGADAIPVPDAVGDVPVHVAAQPSQDPSDQRSTRNTVHIVVAVDENAFAGSQRLLNPRDRRVHPGQQERVAQVRQRTRQKLGGRRNGVDPAVAQDRGYDA